jgi:hypothetical protein
MMHMMILDDEHDTVSYGFLPRQGMLAASLPSLLSLFVFKQQ